jgi:putative salt-induced outer membrane protein YdiY
MTTLFGLAVMSAAPVHAQDPCPPCPTPTPPPPPPHLTGSLGAGLALTAGNTDTTNINLAFTLKYDPEKRNIIRADGLYLKGSQDDEDIVSQTTAGLRDEYRLSKNSFVFGEVRYLRDPFKDISYLWTPVAGLGYKPFNTDIAKLSFDVALGGAFEKNEGRDATSDGAFHAGQSFMWKISKNATFIQAATGIWKMSDTSDAHYHFEAGLAAAVTKFSELKVSIKDDIKNKPVSPELKKSDTAVLVTFLVKR